MNICLTGNAVGIEGGSANSPQVIPGVTEDDLMLLRGLLIVDPVHVAGEEHGFDADELSNFGAAP